MLHHFPPAFPDETLYSVLCRLKKELGTKGNLKFERILGKQTHDADLNFPVGLKILEGRTDPEWFDAEKVIREQTILPYYRPFNTEENYSRWREGIFAGISVYRAMGLVRMAHALKACPLCLAHDAKVFGQPYYHCSHQVSGAEACHIHGIRLEAVVLRNAERLPYISLAEQSSYFDVPPRMAHEVWVRLARDFQDLLTLFPDRGCADFLKFMAGCIRDLTKGIRRKDWSSVVNHYLKDAAPEVSSRFIRRLSWTDNALLSSIRTVYPARYLILIRACGLTPEAIANFRPKRTAPIHKKWPCLNRLCPHHRQEVMRLEKVFFAPRGSHPKRKQRYFILKCPHCGRTTVQVDDRTTYRGHITRILDFGPSWTKKFRSLWMDPKVTYKEVERQLGLNIGGSIVPFHAAYLNGLPLDRGDGEHRRKPLSDYLAKKERTPILERAMLELETLSSAESMSRKTCADPVS